MCVNVCECVCVRLPHVCRLIVFPFKQRGVQVNEWLLWDSDGIGPQRFVPSHHTAHVNRKPQTQALPLFVKKFLAIVDPVFPILRTVCSAERKRDR